MIGARFGMLGERGGVGKYVEDGLIVWLDGKDNSGVGTHSAAAKTWVNLGTAGATYNATTSGGVWEDDCAVFDGSSANVFSIGNSIMSNSMGGEWSVECTFKLADGAYANYKGVFGNHGNYSRYGIIGGQHENGNMSFSIWGSSRGVGGWTANAATDFPLNATHRVTLKESTSSSYFKVYKDTVLKNTIATTTGISNTDAFYIGRAFNSADRCMIGRVYSLRIYNRPLTDEEILQNYKVDKYRFGV